MTPGGQSGTSPSAHGHRHAIDTDADRRYLIGALVLLVGFMAAEVIVGFIASSLGLIADAAHMLTDAGAIGLALVAMRLSARPPRGGFTFGLKRSEILSAQANGITFLLLTVYFVYQGIRRLIEPPEVEGLLVLVTALAGVAANLGATWLMSRANRSSLNVQGAYLHVLNDLYAFLTVAAAGLVIMLTGFARADAIAALLVAGLMAKAGIGLVRDSGRVFLEAAPDGLDPDQIGREVAARSQVAEVHDLHIWEITSGFPAASAHVLVEPGRDCHAVRRDIEELLRERHDIHHTTLQVDHAGPEVLQVRSTPGIEECHTDCGDTPYVRAHSEDRRLQGDPP